MVCVLLQAVLLLELLLHTCGCPSLQRPHLQVRYADVEGVRRAAEPHHPAVCDVERAQVASLGGEVPHPVDAAVCHLTRQQLQLTVHQQRSCGSMDQGGFKADGYS